MGLYGGYADFAVPLYAEYGAVRPASEFNLLPDHLFDTEHTAAAAAVAAADPLPTPPELLIPLFLEGSRTVPKG